MFIAARGIIGIGLAFNITAAPILIMELAFPTQKVKSLLEIHWFSSNMRRLKWSASTMLCGI